MKIGHNSSAPERIATGQKRKDSLELEPDTILTNFAQSNIIIV